MLEIIIVIAGVIIITILALSFVFSSSHKASFKPDRFCPICRSKLNDNQSVYGVLLSQKPPQKIEIQGCPHCLKKPAGELDI